MLVNTSLSTLIKFKHKDDKMTVVKVMRHLVIMVSGLLVSVVPIVANNVPPNSFRGQIWTSANGCKYTRAGLQGETIWYLIVNSRKGRDCELKIVQTPGTDQ